MATVVDTHCHASAVWYQPVESLLFEMDRNGVDHAVLIQMQGQSDNSYQRECVRKHPDRVSSVVIVGSAEQLEREAGEGAVGVRLRPADSAALWEAAPRLGLPVSCAGVGPELARYADAGTTIVIEHLGGLNHPDTVDRGPAWNLARRRNVYMKFHGLGEFCKRKLPVPSGDFPFERPLPSTLQQAYDAFGPDRLMWGSDYPPVASREGYGNALRLPKAELPAEQHDKLFGGVALTVFKRRL